MFRQLLFVASLGLAAASSVSGVSFFAADENGTFVGPDETPVSLTVGFTATSASTSVATITLPAGMISDGTMTIGSRRLGEVDESDNDGRRLSATCEPYGTVTVSSNTMTVNIRQVGTVSDPCPSAGAQITIPLTANTAVFNSVGTGQLDFTVVTDVDGDPASVSYTVDGSGSYSLSAIGDPITWYDGQKYKFWLPVGDLMPLLETPEMTVWASTFQGPSIDYQWFDRFMVTGKDGSEIVDVRVNRVMAGSNRSHFKSNHFTQLDVKMSGKPLRSRRQQLFAAGDAVQVGVGARTVNPARLLHTAQLEFVMVESKSISFMVHASHAGAEFPNDVEHQVKYTHLDWINLDMANPKKNDFQGILPQIWGIQPRTPEVEALLIAPSQTQMAVCSFE